MNKILIAAALLVATTIPTLPANAATMAMAMKAPTSAECMLMPLLPGCAAMMKTEHDAMMAAKPPMKMAMAKPMMAKPAMAAPAMAKPAMAMPAMMMWPTCVAAPAGSGHLFDCTMPK